MAKYRDIKITKGAGGFGGPLIIKPTEKKHKVLFITIAVELLGAVFIQRKEYLP